MTLALLEARWWIAGAMTVAWVLIVCWLITGTRDDRSRP